MTGARGEEDTGSTSVLAGRRWLFGTALLDERSLALTVNGVDVELERKPLEVLLHLLRHAGEVVTKDELLAAVWPGRVLSDSALTSCMHKLRGALDDEAQNLIKTQHGYGYRLVAPVRVETAVAPVPPRFDFKAGDHPPLRPLWSLVERLGTGGHGEAWLARHDKTREARVFKFAGDGATLTSLKREITLYRLLHDSLGERRDFVRILDWNLEEAPYFIEADYTEGGSLVAWAAAQGGVGAVPLSTRLELAAQIADALAAAHSVGVLHKDLKPSNVLVDSADDRPFVKLCDFGSGSVLDPQRLEQLGITRLGFTQALSPADTTSGTPLYLAPEVVAGQPFTLQSDIYSLGVLLYQLVAGDFHKPLAPGWEQDIADELLREDIAAAADGNPERRLADAAQFALRLRTLDQRQRSRSAERAAQAETAEAKLQMERMRARQNWVRLAFAVLVAGVTTSSLLYIEARRARVRADDATAAERAVSDFLGKDMFAQISADRPLRGLTVKELVDQAASRVDRRFGAQLSAAARVHQSLGASYLALDDAAGAEKELDAALALATQAEGPGSDTAMAAVGDLLTVKFILGKLNDVMAEYEAVLAAGSRRLGPIDHRVLALRAQFATIRIHRGERQAAAADLRQLIADAKAAPIPDEALLGEAENKLGLSLYFLAEYAGAEEALRGATSRLNRLHGERHIAVATAQTFHAAALTRLARYREADTELVTALAIAQAWTPSDAQALVLLIRQQQAESWKEQGDLGAAAATLESVRAVFAGWKGPEADQSYSVRFALGEVYQRQRRLPEAVAEMRAAVRSAEALLGEAHDSVLEFRAGLADALREQGRVTDARDVLAGIRAETVAGLMLRHPHLAALRRVEGLLALAAGDRDKARAALEEAFRIDEYRFGKDHWRTKRVSGELAELSSGRGGS